MKDHFACEKPIAFYLCKTESPVLHKYGPVRVSGKADAAAEPKAQGRAYESSLARFPNHARLIVQKQLLKFVHINGVMFKLIEAVPVVAQTNR